MRGETPSSQPTATRITAVCGCRIVAWLRACGLLLDAGRARRRTGKMARFTLGQRNKSLFLTSMLVVATFRFSESAAFA